MQKSPKNWKWPDEDIYIYKDIKQKINIPKRVNIKREVYIYYKYISSLKTVNK